MNRTRASVGLSAAAILVDALLLIPVLHAQSGIQVLYNFQNDAHGFQPLGTLAEVTPGVLEGTTAAGMNGATAFAITASGTLKTIVTFDQNTEGFGLIGQPYQASNGVLYGSAESGEPGSVYALTVNGALRALQLTYNASPLMEASDGNLYGVEGNQATGDYSIFRMTLSGEITDIYDLGPNARLIGPLFQASDGNLYGITTGENDIPGIVFRISVTGKNFTVLHTFKPGQGSEGGFMQASNGLLYGIAVYGYPYSPCPGVGSYLFSMTLQGQVKPLITWTGCPGPGPNGPATGVIEASDGNIYGTAVTAGGFYEGTLWSVGLDGSNYQKLVNFGLGIGIYPGGQGGPAVIQGSDGWLYGTASSGGLYQEGTVFRWNNNLPLPLPAINYFRPRTGAVGSTVLISGQHLVGVTGVSFNGTAASSVVSRGDRYVIVTVPPSATSGPITVTTPNGSGSSQFNFTVE